MSNNNRIPIQEAWKIAKLVGNSLKATNLKHEVCGSLKRGNKPDAGDIDIAVSSIEKAIQSLYNFPMINGGSKQAHINIYGVQVGLYQSDLNSWGAMTLFLTGSGKFNISMRIYAKAHSLKLNQYGLWNGSELVASQTEEGIFSSLGLKYINPKEREFMGKENLWKYKI